MQDFDLGELEFGRASGERLRLCRRAGEGRPGTASTSAVRSAAELAAAPPRGPLSGAAHGNPLHQGGGRAEGRPQAPAQDIFVVSAPLVGTFYRAAGPESPPYVEIGQRVKKGQTLCIIEAMKLMNELESDVDGTVVSCLADNSRPVEYGQALFYIQRP